QKKGGDKKREMIASKESKNQEEDKEESNGRREKTQTKTDNQKIISTKQKRKLIKKSQPTAKDWFIKGLMAEIDGNDDKAKQYYLKASKGGYNEQPDQDTKQSDTSK